MTAIANSARVSRITVSTIKCNIFTVTVLLFVLFVMVTGSSAKNWDKSQFYSAQLLDDGHTVLFTYTDASYVVAGGSLMSFGGGSSQYTKDSKFIGLYHMDRKKTVVIRKFGKEPGTKGRGNFLIRSRTRGRKAYVIRQSRHRREESLPGERYLLDVDKKALTLIPIEKEMADLGMIDWKPMRLAHGDGSFVLLAYSSDQKAGYNLGHVWLRSGSGQYQLLTQFGSCSATLDGNVFYYDHSRRTRHVLNLETEQTRTISNREYSDRVPGNLCYGKYCTDLSIGVSSDGKGLELSRKIDGKWQDEPFPIDMSPLR